MSGERSRVALALTLMAVLAAILIGVLTGGAAPVSGRSPLSAAMATLPESMVGVGFTDWNQALRGQSATEARRRDLITRSVFHELPADYRTPLGLEARDLAWEAYARDPRREVELMRLNRGASVDEAGLQQAGYRRMGDLWIAREGTSARESTLAALAWLPRQRLVVASSKAAVVAEVLDIVAGRSPALAANPYAREAAEALSGSTSVLLESGVVGCAATRVGIDADGEAQARAAQDRVGALERYHFLGRGLSDVRGKRDIQEFVLAMPFSSTAQAGAQARIRGELSAGPFIGRIGSMDDVLRLTSARVSGTTAVLTYDHPVDSGVLMTGRGPLLPAACGP
jgi:hypothetical protein